MRMDRFQRYGALETIYSSQYAKIPGYINKPCRPTLRSYGNSPLFSVDVNLAMIHCYLINFSELVSMMSTEGLPADAWKHSVLLLGLYTVYVLQLQGFRGKMLDYEDEWDFNLIEMLNLVQFYCIVCL